MGIFNLVDQAASYGAYHNNNVNKFVHIIFVPAILYTAIIFINLLDVSPTLSEYFLAPLNTLSQGFIPVTIGTPLAIAISLYYCALDSRVGLLATIWIMSANYLAFYTNIVLGDKCLFFAISLHIFSWVSQFVGHYIEGRRPALIDNLFQVFIAPFFVTLEVLFIFGLLRQERIMVENKIQQNIDAAKKKKI
ncbi:hypothetical protein CYY_009284 [Polysphondylium violaceum]|uniref:DUF962 domain-containing protein n=1 Tax=Polysphondylium violaceum TaxID=133409 RepID=A0A8J4PKA3_9MYCE|nr:hypothetical protein CYY_009284 [Polysphondylium violaceum]